MIRRSGRARVVLGASVVAALAAAVLACAPRPRSFAELSQAAAGVPVPAGVAFVREQQSTEHGAGFTSDRYEQVVRTFTTSLGCAELLGAWRAALDAASVRYTVEDFPAPRLIKLHITDGSPAYLGVTLGSAGHCERPFVWSFNRPH